MLFAVKMDVDLPVDMDPVVKADTLAREKAYSQKLQQGGEWAHLWRCVGQYSNLSVFDVADNERLHEILWNLPLFPYMTIEVTPLAQHPSDIALLGS
ncbi:muconolactone Delta-isomerase [Saccharopolyspora shandongensis]|uniref:Muconolactone Delta-isomerase n=1 Tax=Saccharopolyspora shandongensis TaxID=418495 RepID=A0A1H2XZJ1_9PSEU|nr:muconolactone Delta-isomerase [Saccharopolyspora shandongensis]SDW98317.1 muconolactone D-isomerase [Saccharopolyspora shandongensis]